MAFKEIKFNDTLDIKKDKTKSVEGAYLGAKKIITQLGEQYIYRFRSDSGEIKGIYGFSALNQKMESVAKGAYTKVTYTGMKEVQTKFGKKPVHQCKVEIDDERSTSVDDESLDMDI